MPHLHQLRRQPTTSTTVPVGGPARAVPYIAAHLYAHGATYRAICVTRCVKHWATLSAQDQPKIVPMGVGVRLPAGTLIVGNV